MPSVTPMHLALFGAGALLGAGAAVVSSRRAATPPLSAPVPSSPAVGVPAPAPGTAKVIAQEGDLVQVGRPDVGSEVFRWGFPGPVPDILHRSSYITAYDRARRHPAWTAQHLTAANLARPPAGGGAPNADRKNSQFKEDADVPELFRAKLGEYFRSGYDRGHMVPAADAKASQVAMNETFLLTNIAPQVGQGFNRDYWAYLESFCRNLTNQFAHVYVFTVPLYLPKKQPDGKFVVSYPVLGDPTGPTPTISVPTHFAKIILTSRDESHSSLSLGAFVLPNLPIPDEVPLQTFAVPVEQVERASGLLLFNDTLKRGAKQLCRETKCDVVVRKFDEAGKMIVGPGVKGGRK